MQSSIILIDVGSSSIKIYLLIKGQLQIIDYKTINFKKNFNPQKGISKENFEEIVRLIKKVKEAHSTSPVYIYATAIFRKFEPNALKEFQRAFKEKTGFDFTVIDQEQENEYLELALLGKYITDDPILLINIGGGSSELVVVRENKTVERKNIDIGVGIINTEFPEINETVATTPQEKVAAFVQQFIPKLKNKVHVAINTGRELHYMKITQYPLEDNILFEDPDHPYLIKTSLYIKKNDEVYAKIPLKDLETLMPDNPTWMHGARAYNVLAQTICKTYGIDLIIPSDSNLINGVVRKHFT
jgi:hypothetical protein